MLSKGSSSVLGAAAGSSFFSAAFSVAAVYNPCGFSKTAGSMGLPADCAGAACLFAGASSKPVAMTVTRIYSCMDSSKVAPKMMFASG